MRDKGAGASPRTKVAFSKQFRESEVYSESRYSQIDCQRAGGGKPRYAVIYAAGEQFIANLPVELLVERLCRSAIQMDHFKRDNRVASPSFVSLWLLDCGSFHCSHRIVLPSYCRPQGVAKVVWLICAKWHVDTLSPRRMLLCKCKRRLAITSKRKD